MRIRFLSCLTVLTLMIASLVPATARAQGVEFGVGIAAPVTNRDVVMAAKLDGLGVVRATRSLDASPQLFGELHKVFKVGPKLAMGPMIGFTPAVNLGITSNDQAEQPVGAGFGLLLQVPSKLKQHINVGVLWLITAPMPQMATGWLDGYQAPRTGQFGTPIEPEFKRASLNRVMLTMTVSGFLK
jgi:hypothetical protein